jgi:hypothetical protein
MKNLIILIISLSISTVGFAQLISSIDEIAPFHDNLAAVKKGDQWGFINEQGVLVIDFRSDLVLSKCSDTDFNYPVFKNGRCLVKKLIDDKYFFGYIDITGKEVIKHQFLNATNFKNGYAIIVQFTNDTIGYNDVLKKAMIANKIEEYVIDTNGESVAYLYNIRTYIPSKLNIQLPPNIQSKFIAPNLVAVKNKENSWNIFKY